METVNKDAKSLLAKMLATENIHVVHKRMPTAYFDTKNRELGLPILKEMNGDIYDLMCLHEVGHALWTDNDEWMDIVKKKTDDDVPKSFINVTEDVRIERKIKDKYPGGVKSFLRGYAKLYKDDFFGTANMDYETMNLADKINLHAKVGTLTGITFNEEETAIYDLCKKAVTFKDAVEAAKVLYEYCKEHNEDTDCMSDDHDMMGQEWEESEDYEESESSGSNESMESEDSEDSEILFLGTEKGIYISFDQGSSFETLQLNLPVVPVYDIKIKNDELIVATHGRSFWILEGINLLRQLRVGINKDKPFLFKSSDKIRTVQQLGGGLSDINTESFGKRYSSKIFGEPATYIDKKLNSGEIIQVYLDAGQNPQEGLSIIYYVPENFESELSISIIDSSNHVIRIFNTENTKTFSLKPGLNRIVWDLKNEEIPELPDIPGGQSPFIAKETSILLIPGTYNIRLNVGDEYFYEQSFNFIQDPRSKVSLDDLVLQYDLQKQIQEKYLEIFHKVKWFRKIRDELRQVDVKQISQYKENNFQESLDLILLKLSEIENEIVPFKSYYQTPPVGIPVGIYGKYKELKGGVSGGDYRPTQQSYELFEDLNLRLEEKFLEIDNIIKNDIFGIFKILKYIDISDTTI